jgi:hypothetical protein
LQTDISLSQYLAIQEKGVSAWEFEPELEIANCFVEGRTEIEFFDCECTVMSNLPVPKQNDVYYWEAKIYDKPESTLLSIGMATKPYPLFRLPGSYPLPCAIQLHVFAGVVMLTSLIQAITNIQLPINLQGLADITNHSMPLRTALDLSKAMSLALATALAPAPSSLPATARS